MLNGTRIANEEDEENVFTVTIATQFWPKFDQIASYAVRCILQPATSLPVIIGKN